MKSLLTNATVLRDQYGTIKAANTEYAVLNTLFATEKGVTSVAPK